MPRKAHALLATLLATGGATAAEPAFNPAVTQETVHQTICVSGWTKTIRPPGAYTRAVKVRLLARRGLGEDEAYRFELDHTVPLCLGGAPADDRNLQLQPWNEASEKDAAEACLARSVCAEVMTLAEARELILQDWREAKRICELK